MGNIQNQLRDWAKDTFAQYDMIAKREVNYSFYNQSDLSVITSEVSLCIIGINPNSESSYRDQCSNPNWKYLYENKGMEHILFGNYCRDLAKPNSKSSWETRNKWSYWRGLKKCISETNDSSTLDSGNGYIVTNASFFCTKKAMELPDCLLKETIPFTMELLSITNPKHIIFLSGRDCFERLSSIYSKEDFEFKNVIANIYVGKLKNKTVIGIPHPAYKTNEEIQLIARVLHHIYDQRYEAIDQEQIAELCKKEKDDFYARISHKRERHIISNSKIKTIETAVIDRFSEYKYDNGHRLKLCNDSSYGITIAEGHIEIRAAFEGSINKPRHRDTDPDVITLLKNRGYVNDKNWLGRKKLSEFGCAEEEIIKNVCIEIQELLSILKKFD